VICRDFVTPVDEAGAFDAEPASVAAAPVVVAALLPPAAEELDTAVLLPLPQAAKAVRATPATTEFISLFMSSSSLTR
jgi:hypothetical protein